MRKDQVFTLQVKGWCQSRWPCPASIPQLTRKLGIGHLSMVGKWVCLENNGAIDTTRYRSSYQWIVWTDLWFAASEVPFTLDNFQISVFFSDGLIYNISRWMKTSPGGHVCYARSELLASEVVWAPVTHESYWQARLMFVAEMTLRMLVPRFQHSFCEKRWGKLYLVGALNIFDIFSLVLGMCP